VALELEPVGTITIALQTYLPETLLGGRLVGEAGTSRWEGPRVQASQLGQSAGDWVRINLGHSVQVDARILPRTDEGALDQVTAARLTNKRASLAASTPSSGTPTTSVEFENNWQAIQQSLTDPSVTGDGTRPHDPREPAA